MTRLLKNIQKKSREKLLKSYVMQLINKNMLTLDCIVFVIFISFLNFVIYSKKNYLLTQFCIYDFVFFLFKNRIP